MTSAEEEATLASVVEATIFASEEAMILVLAEATLALGEETTGVESETRRGAILASVVEATILAVREETILTSKEPTISVSAEAPTYVGWGGDDNGIGGVVDKVIIESSHITCAKILATRRI